MRLARGLFVFFLLPLLLWGLTGCEPPVERGLSDLGPRDDVDLAPIPSPPLAPFYGELVFRSVAGKTLAGDLYLPSTEGLRPVVVIIHGGGFRAGDKAGGTEIAWANQLVAAGFAAFSINYRLIDDYAGASAPPPFVGSLGDAKCAVQWLRQHAATYRLDVARVFAFGSSAGGWFSNMLAVTGDEPTLAPDCPLAEGQSNRVAAAVTYYGPSDFPALFADPSRVGAENGEQELVGAASDCLDPAFVGVCSAASPTYWVDANDPPMFLTHSADDPVVPVSQSRLLDATLRAAGVDVTYDEVDGVGHGWHAKFGIPTVAGVRDEVLAWLTARQ